MLLYKTHSFSVLFIHEQDFEVRVRWQNQKFLSFWNNFLYFVHICVYDLIPMNIQIFIDFKGPIIDDNFYPMTKT